MPRAMWRGAISFGMVAIPIRLYLATESKSVSFRLLCPDCHTPIKNRRWCPNEEKEISWNDAVRGYEIAKDEYVEISDAELDQLPIRTTHEIEIVEFCSDEEINASVYVDHSYFLEPEAVGTKPYLLLKQALERTGKVAIGKIALRDREHLCRVALYENGLVLNTLHWPDEIRDFGQLTIPTDDSQVHKREVDMAVMLVENLSAKFEPEKFKDEYREAVEELAEAKAASKPLPKAKPQPEGKVMDLMAALKASLDATKGGGAAQEQEKEKRPARRRKAS